MDLLIILKHYLLLQDNHDCNHCNPQNKINLSNNLLNITLLLSLVLSNDS